VVPELEPRFWGARVLGGEQRPARDSTVTRACGHDERVSPGRHSAAKC
jgi:hypothetical protein